MSCSQKGNSKADGRVEKLDIVNMAEKYIKSLKSQMKVNNSKQDDEDRLLESYFKGLADCFSETVRFLSYFVEYHPMEVISHRLQEHLQAVVDSKPSSVKMRDTSKESSEVGADFVYPARESINLWDEKIFGNHFGIKAKPREALISAHSPSFVKYGPKHVKHREKRRERLNRKPKDASTEEKLMKSSVTMSDDLSYSSGSGSALNGWESPRNEAKGSNSVAVHPLVPAFALHPTGSFYFPLSLEFDLVLEKAANLGFDSQQHIISIPIIV